MEIQKKHQKISDPSYRPNSPTSAALQASSLLGRREPVRLGGSAATGLGSMAPMAPMAPCPPCPPWLPWPNTMAGWNPKVGPSLKRREDLLDLLSWIRLKRPISVPTLKGPQFLNTCTQEIGLEICQATSSQIDCGFQPIPKDAWQLDMNHTKKGRNIKQALESLEHQPGNEFSDLPTVGCGWLDVHDLTSERLCPLSSSWQSQSPSQQRQPIDK